MSTSRRRGEARDAIIVAARKEFGRSGYVETSIKDIAHAAGTSATLIYRYFGSKAALFEETVVGPGRAFVDGFIRRWAELGPQAGRRELLADLVEGIYDFVVEYQGLISAWAAAGRHGASDIVADGSHGSGLRGLAQALYAHTPQDDEDEATMLVTCTAATVLAMVILDDVLLPGGSRLRDRDVQIRAITRYAQSAVDTRLLDPART